MTILRDLRTRSLSAAVGSCGAGLLLAAALACGGGGTTGATAGKASPTPLPPPVPTASAGTLSLFAGNPGGRGTADGVGAAARFLAPVAVVTDPAGNLLIGDADNRAIRKIAPNSTVTTIAGRLGVSGWKDGFLGANLLAQPAVLARAADGTLYVGDTLASGLAKISPDGYMTTILPGGSNTYTDGVSANVRFSGIFGMALDPAGFLYIADNRNHAIRKVNLATTETTTVAGGTKIVSGSRTGSTDGPLSTAQIGYPSGIVWTPGDVLYVACYRSHTIRKIDLRVGQVSTLAGVPASGGFVDGVGSVARFRFPIGLALDGKGNLLVSDMGNNAIRTIDLASGAATTVAGNTSGAAGAQDGIGTAAGFNQPWGLTTDDLGHAFVGDYQNGTVRRITLSTKEVSTVAGAAPMPGSTDGPRLSALFNDAYGLCRDVSGNLFVADTANHVIRKIATDGTVSLYAGVKGTPGNLNGAAATATFTRPVDLVADASGNVYVADLGNNCIRMIAPDGTVSTFAGSLTGAGGALDGQGTAATFRSPGGLALTAAGQLYVADSGNNLIRTVNLADGVVTTFAGATTAGVADGVGTAARFRGPYGLALDAQGGLIVADTLNHALRRIDLATATVVTLAGDAGTVGSTSGRAGSLDGTGTTARFNTPYRVQLDAAGVLLVGDYGNNAVRKVTPAGVVSTIVGTFQDALQGSRPGIVLGDLPGQIDFPKALLPQADGSVLVISNHCILQFTGY